MDFVTILMRLFYLLTDTLNLQFNVTSVFKEWMEDKSTDHGILIKDSQHESVPGYFLKFASLNHKDPTIRPYLMVCQKKRECPDYIVQYQQWRIVKFILNHSINHILMLA